MTKKTLKEIQDEIKTMKKDSKDHTATTIKKLNELEEQIKGHLAYRQLIITSARSNQPSETVVNGLKFAAEKIKTKEWSMAERVGGTSGDLQSRGACPVCDVNIMEATQRPRESAFPCYVKECPYE
jgi:hypothetical protein